jgi:4-hydroxybenzoate polyprenyltransferase
MHTDRATFAEPVAGAARAEAREWAPGTSTLSAVLRQLRPHQWLKNLLLLLPVALAHQLRDVHKLAAAAAGVACFCLAASAVYALNDLLDREADRGHPAKRARPIASGALSPAHGVGLLIVLLAAALGLAPVMVNARFLGWLIGYAALAVVYSVFLKRRLLVDVLALAALYTLRLLAGGAAAEVEVSKWLLAFSMFLFLSLAFAKRYAELRDAAGRGVAQPAGRNYSTEDLPVVVSLGSGAGLVSVLVLALYVSSVNTPGVKVTYPHPDLLWLLCPLLLYWVSRLWFFATRGKLHHDPVVFAATDAKSWAVAAAAVALVVAAALPWSLTR